MGPPARSFDLPTPPRIPFASVKCGFSVFTSENISNVKMPIPHY
jgi:hypothetical protein